MTNTRLITLNPQMRVSGTVRRVDESNGEKPFEFTAGLAVSITETVGERIYDYTVVMPNGRVYTVNDGDITSATPWTPTPNPSRRVQGDAETARDQLRGTALSAMADELWKVLSKKPMTYAEIRKWAGGDTRKRMLSAAITHLTEQKLVTVDGSNIYWAVRDGNPIPADLAGQFTLRTEGDTPKCL